MAQFPDKIETMMKDLECTGKRVTKELIESRIESVDYQTVIIAGQKMMFCGIRMLGGFVAVGKPAVCIDPSNWRDEIGREISYDNAFAELWRLEAYHMTYQAPGDFKSRLKLETEELGERLTKLTSFISSDAFNTVSTEQQELLSTQCMQMGELYKTLASRLSKV